jgi:hypothetical protein
MPVSDLDIHRAAYQWIAQHGDNATAKARQMVELMRQKGDTPGNPQLGLQADCDASTQPSFIIGRRYSAASAR